LSLVRIIVNVLTSYRMMGTLEATQQRLLQNDPANPNSPKKADEVQVRPGLGFSKSTSGPLKPSIREAMLAQKKALAAKNPPARPGSAMSSFSPVRTVSTASTSSIASHISEVPASRSRPEATSSVSHGGLSVAPMRPTKLRPKPEPARPATAGPYSVRRPPHAPPGPNETSSTTPSGPKAKPVSRTPAVATTSPKRTIPRPNTSHSSHASHSSNTSPLRDRLTVSRDGPSPQESPKISFPTSSYQGSSPSKADEDFTMVMPAMTKSPVGHKVPTVASFKDDRLSTPGKSLRVYEDPFSGGDKTTPRPLFTAPVLEELPVNEDSLNVARTDMTAELPEKTNGLSPDRVKQNSKLLDSGITRVKAQTLDVHGFRKLQGLVRETKTMSSDSRFDSLISGLFEYLEAPLESLTPEKVQDVKAQVLATIRLMLKKDRDVFQSHVPQGLQSILATRSCYDARAHIVSGLELLADDLITLGDPNETANTIINRLQAGEMTAEGSRTLNMGLHILKELLDSTMAFSPTDQQTHDMAKLAIRCLESSLSGIRMDAVQLCVALHARIGEKDFWGVMAGVKDDPKSLITYYIVKRERETASS
jgi:CLIP-associating protein 1/2